MKLKLNTLEFEDFEHGAERSDQQVARAVGQLGRPPAITRPRVGRRVLLRIILGLSRAKIPPVHQGSPCDELRQRGKTLPIAMGQHLTRGQRPGATQRSTQGSCHGVYATPYTCSASPGTCWTYLIFAAEKMLAPPCEYGRATSIIQPSP